jgi:hypothetical protein
MGDCGRCARSLKHLLLAELEPQLTALAISLFVLIFGVDAQIAKPAFGTCERLGRNIVGERPGKPSAKQFP